MAAPLPNKTEVTSSFYAPQSGAARVTRGGKPKMTFKPAPPKRERNAPSSQFELPPPDVFVPPPPVESRNWGQRVHRDFRQIVHLDAHSGLAPGGSSSSLQKVGAASKLHHFDDDTENPGLHTIASQSQNFPVTLPIAVNPNNPDFREQEGSSFFTSESSEMEIKEDTLFLIQLPTAIPLAKKPAAPATPNFQTLPHPPGHAGKLLVYKSGKIKLQLGDAKFDVAIAKTGTSAQSLIALNTKANNCYMLGDVARTMVATPVMDDIIPRYTGAD
eukprot:TRINITY_DN95473_c0_g1_i1.p1 TRINITY_DN95473_c0_g1~~TRINITY_DN95473_c0_g1_i1.p1  ORF type:complete len:286 (+),score=31.45 TRINITY_DN95473_c0_g1_i1:40-858(+)